MRAGLLRDRVIVLRKSVASDGMGGQTETWAEQATVNATVTVSMTNAYISGPGQVAPIVSHTVRMRGDVDVTSADRLSWEGRVLDIVDVSPTNDRPTQQVAVCQVRIGESYG